MIIRYECPITGCGWHYDRPAPEMTLDDWRGTIEESVYAAVTREYMDANRIIEAHMATHTPTQWLTEINALVQRAEQAERDLAAITGMWRGIADFDDAMRRFHNTAGTAQADAGDIKARLLAMAETMAEGS